MVTCTVFHKMTYVWRVVDCNVYKIFNVMTYGRLVVGCDLYDIPQRDLSKMTYVATTLVAWAKKCRGHGVPVRLLDV
jgi:hypothetical protein